MISEYVGQQIGEKLIDLMTRLQPDQPFLCLGTTRDGKNISGCKLDIERSSTLRGGKKVLFYLVGDDRQYAWYSEGESPGVGQFETIVTKLIIL